MLVTNFDNKISQLIFRRERYRENQLAVGLFFCFLLNLTLFITLTNKLTDQYLKAKKNAVSQTETHKKDVKYKPCNMS